jgi:hypothetical protein
MIKQGDRVYPYYNMGHKGKVVRVVSSAVTANMVGGTLSAELLAEILLDDGKTVVMYRMQDLMREE